MEAWTQKKIGFATDGEEQNRICICTDIKPLSAFKAKVKELYEAGTPITFRLRIGIPIKIKITDETELAQLKEFDKQIAFYGINNINTYPTDNLEKAPLKLKATYDKSNRIIIERQAETITSQDKRITALEATVNTLLGGK